VSLFFSLSEPHTVSSGPCTVLVLVMGLLNVFLVIASLSAKCVTSQETIIQEQLLSSVIFTTYGDRTPFILPIDPTLTPLGASQLYNVGSAFRNRYISSENGSNVDSTAIMGISPYVLDNSEIAILSTQDQYIVASASAFMQGLCKF
jgi:Histidine phosphatase superfamily (branch 2)